MAVNHPPSGIAGSTPARRTDHEQQTNHDQVVELGYTRRSERRAARHGSSTLPLVTGRTVQVGQRPAEFHKLSLPGATPGPAIYEK